MLTATERRRIQICEAYKTEQPRPTQDELAARFGISAVSIRAALRWGERFGLFTDDLAERLRVQIAEWRKHLEFLEGELRIRQSIARGLRSSGKKVGVSTTAIKAISSELREVRTRIDELEGIYKQTVNVQLTGKDGAPLPTRIEWVVVKPDADRDR